MPDLRHQLEHCFPGRVCLVGVGNTDLGDDALGLRLAEAVRAAGEWSTFPTEFPPATAIGRSVPPHPNPLPQEEGTAGKPPLKSAELAWQSPRRMVLPLPQGEGRGEGEQTPDRGTVCTVLLAGVTPERHLTHLTDAGFDHVIFLDAVEFGGAPGSVVFLNAKEMETRFPQVSTHKLSLGLLARWIESNGTTRAWLLGVQPASCQSGAPLSSPVQRAVELLTALLADIAPCSGSRSADVQSNSIAGNRSIPRQCAGTGARTFLSAATPVRGSGLDEAKPGGHSEPAADRNVRAPFIAARRRCAVSQVCNLQGDRSHPDVMHVYHWGHIYSLCISALAWPF